MPGKEDRAAILAYDRIVRGDLWATCVLQDNAEV